MLTRLAVARYRSTWDSKSRSLPWKCSHTSEVTLSKCVWKASVISCSKGLTQSKDHTMRSRQRSKCPRRPTFLALNFQATDRRSTSVPSAQSSRYSASYFSSQVRIWAITSTFTIKLSTIPSLRVWKSINLEVPKEGSHPHPCTQNRKKMLSLWLCDQRQSHKTWASSQSRCFPSTQCHLQASHHLAR